ncbi:hypothetical protein HERIO_1433 [Hepatospora eriocheir]|uniref:Uncharacterized protein n=1 Tax=Hepatospora eriocheir TaxID=1081669 RepID=A0A1X0QA36_9MICR|nr:hypothetical protein HERIO_1433 [Hepatospora eriocheir]
MMKTLVNFIILCLVLDNVNKCISNNGDIRTERFFRHYFIVMAVLLGFDSAASILLNRIPYYHVIKLMTIALIGLPNSQGPYFIYNMYLSQLNIVFSKYLSYFNQLALNLRDSLTKRYNNSSAITTSIDRVLFTNIKKHSDYFKQMFFKQQDESVKSNLTVEDDSNKNFKEKTKTCCKSNEDSPNQLPPLGEKKCCKSKMVKTE